MSSSSPASAAAPSLVLLHNPKCSKSRAALELLERSERPFAVREYLRDPLSADELRRLANALREGPVPSQAPALDRDALPTASDEEVIEAVAADPSRMQRPVLLDTTRHAAVIGRPPANLLHMLHESKQ